MAAREYFDSIVSVSFIVGTLLSSAISTGLLVGGLWLLHFVGVTAADPAMFLNRFATPVFLVMVVLCVVMALVSELVSSGEFEWIEACAP